ncbi:MAG: PDZ domain-containing protein [Halomonadaceae bacterium]|nr:MAG: PDZ domain-containing protein [Halomonadaceae bacterium]
MTAKYRLSTLLPALLVLMVLMGLMQSVHARELAVPEEDMVQVEIATLAMSMSGAPVVLLREPNASQVIPILIGPEEATAIIRARQQIRTPRPMTHDLFGPVFSTLDATLERVFIDELANNTFLGALELTVNGETRLVDSRPSDALAIAIRLGASIHVSPSVMEAATSIEYEGLDDAPVTAMGITVDRLTPELRDALELDEDQPGLLVTDVTGPAKTQGLEPGDLLLAVNGEAPETALDFLEQVRKTEEGEQARIDYWQDGEEKQMQVPTDVPDSRPDVLDQEGGISL